MLAQNLIFPDSKMQKNIQVFFTKENKKTWELSLQKKIEFIKKYHQFISKDYIDGFYALELIPNEIPSLEKLNLLLEKTGWEAVYVDGYLQQDEYAKFLSQKITPISRHMRSLAHINYAPGPDMLHDIFGHLPMLFSPEYSDYLFEIGKVMAQTSANTLENRLYDLQIKLTQSHEDLGSDHPQTKNIENNIKDIEHEINRSLPMYTLLGRFFIWTIEFGILLNHEKKLQMYGAGLLSSENESVKFCEGKTKVIPFTAASAKMEFDFSSFQKQLFFSDSFGALSDQLKHLSSQN